MNSCKAFCHVILVYHKERKFGILNWSKEFCLANIRNEPYIWLQFLVLLFNTFQTKPVTLITPITMVEIDIDLSYFNNRR